MPIYLLAQLLGALLAAAVLQVLYMDGAATTTVPYASSSKAFIVEVISGFNLMFVATAVSTGSQTVSNRFQIFSLIHPDYPHG